LNARTITMYGPTLAKAAALVGVSGAVSACPYGDSKFPKYFGGHQQFGKAHD
jgi:hypothetical protein